MRELVDADARALRVLINDAVRNPESFFGLSRSNIACKMHDLPISRSNKLTDEQRKEARVAIQALKLLGYVYAIPGTRPRRYFPSSKVIVHATFKAHERKAGGPARSKMWKTKRALSERKLDTLRDDLVKKLVRVPQNPLSTSV